MLSKLAMNGRHISAGRRLAVPLSRNFWNVSLPVLGGPGGSHVTKYKIVKPFKDGVDYDDYLVALPERDHLVSFTKDVPLFIRYLKVVTDQEGRGEAFQAFVERAKSGLVVETDVYISTEELLALMWKNGYSEQERNAIQFTFPSDYKFHYPELSVLFDLAEEDTYKFCMRTRIESSHLGELDHDKVKPSGWIRNHWVFFGTGMLIFKSFPFYNYYFGLKVFGSSMWLWTVWTGLNRMIAKACRRNEYMAAQKTATDIMEGEDKVVAAMQLFANDSRCVDHLSSFKAETESSIGAYRKALVLQMKDELSDRATKQLQAVAQFEASMGSALQELVVREAAASFRDAFPTNADMQAKAFAVALKGLAGTPTSAGDDPVATHFDAAFKSLQGVDLMTAKGNATGTLAERVAAAQQSKEVEFQQTFMVTKSEAAEVKALVSQAKSGSGFDFANLSAESAKRLDQLYSSINAKVGFATGQIELEPIPEGADAAANAYIKQVNAQVATAARELRAARLTSFAQAFA